MHTGPVRNGPYAGQIKSGKGSLYNVGGIYLVLEPMTVSPAPTGTLVWHDEEGGYWEWVERELRPAEVIVE